MLGSKFPMFVAWGPELGFLYNDAYAVILGEKHPRAMGGRFEDIWKEIWSEVGPLAHRALKGEATWLEDLPLVMNRRGYDEQTWFTFSYSPVRGDEGEIAGMFCAVAETTDKVLAQRRLTDGAARQRRLFEQAPGFIIIMRGPDHVVEFVNDAHKRTFASGEWEGRTIRDAFPSLEGQGFFERLDEVYRTGETYEADGVTVSFQRGPHEPVQTRALTFIYAPLHDTDGNISGIFCEGFDVTEARNADLRNASLSALADVVRDIEDPDAIAFAAAEILARALQVSRAGYGTIDTVAETIAIERDWNAPGISSIEGVLNFRDYGSYIDDLKAGRTVVISNADLDPRTREKAQSLKAISAHSFVNMPVTEQGDAVALLFLNHAEPREWRIDELELIQEFADRTRTAVERRRAEIALARTARELTELNETLEQRVAAALAEKKVYADIVESSQSSVTALDLEGNILAINRANIDAFERIYGKRPAVGDRFLDFFEGSPEHLEQQRLIWSRALSGEAFEIVQEFGDGRHDRRSYEVRFSPLLNSDGTRIGASSTSYDVTDRIQAEAQLMAAQEQLREAQKMEAMGQLTGGVAHDFNNLLSPIVGSLDMLMRSGVGSEREKRLISAAMQSAERARTLVQRLLAFARRQPLQARAVDVGALVKDMADLISSTIGPQIRVIVQTSDDVPLAHADANQLEMALLNLSVNARDAMPDGGELRIATSPHSVRSKRFLGLAPGDYVKLSIIDNGRGMDEVVLARAVEPFFSTKGVGKGTGLGLSMVDGLARQLGGALAIRSQPGEGTEVDLWLPASEASREVSQPRAGEVKSAGRAGVALIVDDEELVRLSTADMLNDLGYQVVEASSAEEALERVRSGVRPDLLVSDHLMPGMTGIDLARALRVEHQNLKVLIVSGYAESEGVSPDFARLAKPFRKDELSASLTAL
jgi:PAS domain S-box-containing protein